MSDDDRLPVDLDDLAREAAAAQRAWERLAATGGLSTTGDMAARWGVHRETVREATQHPAFPKPVDRVGRADAWLTASVELWRRRRHHPGSSG